MDRARCDPRFAGRVWPAAGMVLGFGFGKRGLVSP